MTAFRHCIHKITCTHCKISLNNTTIRTITINDTLNFYHKRNHLSYIHTHTHTHTPPHNSDLTFHARLLSLHSDRDCIFFVSLFGAVISKCYCCFDWFPKSEPLQCCQMRIQTSNLPADSALLLRGWILC